MVFRSLVVLDTNACFDDPTFSGSRSTRLLSLARRRKIDLAVPAVVLLELKRHHRNAVNARLDQLRKVRAKTEASIRTLHLDPALYQVEFPEFDALDPEQLLADIFHRVHERLEASFVEVLPVPPVSHHDLLERDLASALPFSTSGKGYRDTLIWHSIIDRWQFTNSQAIGYIVTNDTDFGTEGLADELADELPPGADPVIVATVGDLLALDDIAELHAEVEDELLFELVREANDDLDFATELDLAPPDARQALTDAAERAVYSTAESLSGLEVTDAQRQRLGLPRELAELTIVGATAHGGFELTLYEQLDGETLLGEAAVNADVTLSATVEKGDAAILAEPSVSVERWTFDQAEVLLERDARLSFEVRIDVAGAVVEDVTFSGIE